MDVKTAIEKRRAYRSFEPVEITDDMVKDLAGCANLSASCFNSQPWRFVFVKGKDALERVFTTISKGNVWASTASMIIAVFSKKEMDYVATDGRDYYKFDTGIAVATLILRATELGLVAHPIAGYDPQKAKELLGIPQEYDLITLINVGKKAAVMNPVLSDKQKAGEDIRPERLPLEKIYSIDAFSPQLNKI